MAAVRVGSGRVKYSGGSGGSCQAVQTVQAVQVVPAVQAVRVRYHLLVLISREQAKTMRNVAIEMAMDLCIDEKDEERETEAQPAVPGRRREMGGGGRAGCKGP